MAESKVFEKYGHKGTWVEALYIFLFVELIINKKNSKDISVQQYLAFELKDFDIKAYDEWIDRGAQGGEIIIKWLDDNPTEVEKFKVSFGTVYKSKVIIWSDRTKTDYYLQKLQAAFEFENYLEQYFREKHGLELGPYLTPAGQYYQGENELGIEIKNDTLINKYGNIYIEYAEKSKASNYEYVNSGILKDDNTTYFLIGDAKRFWVFRKKRLIEIFKEEQSLKAKKSPSLRGIQFKIKPTSLGYVFPTANAQKEALSIEELVNEIKEKQRK